MSYTVDERSRFKSGLKKFQSLPASQKSRLTTVLNELVHGRSPTPNFNPHPLKGNMAGVWDCHIVGTQWILTYQFDHLNNRIILHCLGSHDDCLC